MKHSGKCYIKTVKGSAFVIFLDCVFSRFFFSSLLVLWKYSNITKFQNVSLIFQKLVGLLPELREIDVSECMQVQSPGVATLGRVCTKLEKVTLRGNLWSNEIDDYMDGWIVYILMERCVTNSKWQQEYFINCYLTKLTRVLVFLRHLCKTLAYTHI